MEPLLRYSVLRPDMLFTGLAGWSSGGRRARDWLGRASSLGPTAVCLWAEFWGRTVGEGDRGTVGHQWGLSRGGEQPGLLPATSEERDTEDPKRKGATGCVRKEVLFGGDPE